MRPALAGVLSGWLLSCWVQVPAPVQSGLKIVVRWISARVADKLADYKSQKKYPLHAKAPAARSSVDPE